MSNDTGPLTHTEFTTKLRLSGAFVVSYLIGFVPMLPFGWEGRWLASIMLSMSLPLALIALSVTFVFAENVGRRPALWTLSGALAAVSLSTLILGLLTISPVGLLSVLVVLPAAVVFYLFARRLRPAREVA